MGSISIGFDSPVNFFDIENIIQYEDIEFTIINGNEHKTHCINSTYSESQEFDKNFTTASHLLNELCWHHQKPFITKISCHSSGPKITATDIPVFKNSSTVYLHDFQQTVFDQKAQLALGFHREAINSNSAFYEFLSYFKIIENAFPVAKDRTDWLNGRLSNIKESTLSINKLKSSGIVDIGKYLYDNGRCALAHSANRNGIVRNICDYKDWQDIVWSVEIVKELAHMVLIQNFNVPKYI